MRTRTHKQTVELCAKIILAEELDLNMELPIEHPLPHQIWKELQEDDREIYRKKARSFISYLMD